MESLIFSLNVTVPIFLLILLGTFFNRIGWMDREFASKVNKFVFRVPLPLLVFKDLAAVNIRECWDTAFVLFCFGATVASILISYGISFLLKDKSARGEFVVVCCRSSSALLGIAIITGIYGEAGMGPLMIIGSVPLYNIMTVAVLTLFKPGNEGISSAMIKKTLIGIAKNPIILGIVAGMIWSLFGIPLEGIPLKTVSSLAATATPMGLMAMGAMFEMGEAKKQSGAALLASFMKLAAFVMIFMPLAIRLGFRGEALIALLVMLGSSTTVASYVMAKNMGHEGVLTSAVVALTTLLAAFTLTFWLFLLRSAELV